MNLSDNLKRIRKENNLSQEQLADKLGVSRQSVSKWESGVAYPEMDKVLQLCKMFNLNIDELLNQDLKEVNENKQKKNNINKLIDDILDYITKTIDLFISMKFKDKVKCIFEQIIIIGVIVTILIIFGLILDEITSSILRFLPDELFYVLNGIIIDGLYVAFCLVVLICLVLHIFKIRYLDYYIIVKEKNEEKDSNEEILVEDKKSKRKFFSKPETERIIIREPKHSGYKFISTLVKFILFILKFFAVLIAFCFCVSFVIFVILLTLSFLFVKIGLLFLGVLFILISCIVVNYVILNILYTFIINKKRNTRLLVLSFLVSLIMVGVGSGLSLIGIRDFKIIDSMDNSRYFSVEEILKMEDNMYFNYILDENYIESDINDIKLVLTYSDLMQHDIYKDSDGRVQIWFGANDTEIFKIINNYIDDINNKRFVDYSNYEVKLYASKENIKKLKDNRDKNRQEEFEYYNELDELRKENNDLRKKLNDLENN